MKKMTNNSASRVMRQKIDTAERTLRRFRTISQSSQAGAKDVLRIVPLGGQHGIGEKNMIVVEYANDAVILDCGFELGIDLPGINYAIPVTEYLQSIRHKLRGYIISHGHMDHIGGLVHILPQFPAPVFGSRFTIGMVETQFEKLNEQETIFTPQVQVLDMDNHERVRLGGMTVELVRVTHAIPESSAIVLDTPAGRIINTGDFRLDPEPLDAMPSDIARLQKLGDEGVLVLMSESTSTTKLGRTPTEHTLQDSFHELVGRTKGRLIIGVFSTNMNRVQMIINAAQANGRKVVLDGRSMMATAELAVRLGNLKIPKGVLVPMREAVNVPDGQLIVICTGGQGELGAALSRMAIGEHQYLKLKKGDSVVISSTPIPGNEQSYQQVGDALALIGATQFRHPTQEIDGCGPLHVSGHAARDEHAEMIQLTRPTYLLPIYGGPLNRAYHAQIGQEQGMKREDIIMAENGTIVEIPLGKRPRIAGQATAGSLLVDQTGEVIPEIVTKDRLLLQNDGFVVVILTCDRASGRLLATPDIISRGHVAVRDNAGVIDGLRAEIRKMSGRRGLSSRHAIDSYRQDARDLAMRYLFKRTKQTPVIVAVVNVVGVGKTNVIPKPVADVCF